MAMKVKKNIISKKSGFTLIELSIVLVILGLLVGGILVGADLIQAARIRAQISDFQAINTGAATFQLKYNALPGDMNSERSSGGRLACSSARRIRFHG